jgi:uncharacterized Fe-S cluster-containing radical SAM superfamily protein
MVGGPTLPVKPALHLACQHAASGLDELRWKRRIRSWSPQDVRQRLRGIASTPAAAARRLEAINARIGRGEPVTESLRLRLDLYYLATDSGPAEHETTDADPDDNDDWSSWR